MSQFDERTREVAAELERLRADQRAILAEAATHLLDREDLLAAGTAGAEAADAAARARALDEQFRAAESLRNRITAVDKRLHKLQEKELTVRDEVRELSQDLDPIYSEIGRIAFDIYRGNPLVDQEYADIFSPLVEVHGELSGIDAGISEQESALNDKPFLEKMVVRGRIALLKNRRATREGSLKRLIRNAGHDILKTAFIDEIGDPTLTAAAEPYRDRVQKTREREDELETIRDERERLRKELESLGADRRPRKRLDELQEEMSQVLQQRETERATVARIVMDHPPEGLGEEVLLLFSRAGDRQDETAALASVHERLQAAIRAEELERRAQSLRAELSRKEARQAEIRREIAALKRQQKTVESELEAARETRGPADELLNNPR